MKCKKCGKEFYPMKINEKEIYHQNMCIYCRISARNNNNVKTKLNEKKANI